MLTDNERETLLHWCWEEMSGSTSHESLCREVARIIAAREGEWRAPIEALAAGYHEDAQAEVNATPSSLARRAVYLRVSGDLAAALGSVSAPGNEAGQ